MRETYFEFINNNNLVIHNNKPTRHMVNTDPSCIDHITSNCPENIYNVKTHLTSSSYHSVLTFTFNTKCTSYLPKKLTLRNHKILTKAALETAFYYNHNIDEMFNSDDPDTIANIFRMSSTILLTVLPLLKKLISRKTPILKRNLMKKLSITIVF